MFLDESLFSDLFLWLTVMICSATLAVALWQAPWRALQQKTERQHAFFAAWMSLVLMMQLSVTWVAGTELHFLAMSSVVVIFGWSFTLIIGAMAQLTFMIWQDNYSPVVAVNYLLSVIVPASVAYAVFRWIVRNKSKNLFIFLLGGGFFGAMLSLLCTVLMLFVVLYLNQQYGQLEKLFNEGLIVVLLCYSEGFLNGLIVTAVTVFSPGIVKVFDEQKYLDS